MRANIIKVGIFFGLFVIGCIAAVIRIVDFQLIHKPDTSFAIPTTSSDPIACRRGSILATDGRFLAFSIPEYKVVMDCCQSDSTKFANGVDSLARGLAAILKDKPAKEYRKMLVGDRKAGKRYTRLTQKYVTYQQMKAICALPILREGRFGGGVMTEMYDRRQYPYGELAFRTLGHIKANETSLVGIEGSCDSLLKGTEGIRYTRMTEHHQWIEDTEHPRVEPVDGVDVRSTIDIDIQDIAERALHRQLAKSDELEAGCVIVMETATGRIRAMANLRKEGKGKYRETYNYAIGQVGEPGSVFKLATLTILLDEGKVKLEDEMPATVNFQCGKGKPLVDHYLDKYKTISILRGFEISSNNVFRIQAYKNYGNNPAHFVEKLANDLHINYKYDFDIRGLGRARIKHPNDGSYWAETDLPQIAMGYTVEVTPLHTLNFYNAIANGGVMVAPRLLEEFSKDGEILKEFPVQTIGRVCKKETVKELHRAMRSVVENGTGYYQFRDCKVAVAGKTGTSRVVMDNGKYEDRLGRHKYQATFAGFFPYENPQYTVMAVIYSYPTHRSFYGATWGGPVVCEIANEIYVNRPEWKQPVTPTGSLPKVEAATLARADSTGGVPDVRGLGLRESLLLLEAQGYQVTASGHGKVSAQHPAPGDTCRNGRIELTLTDEKTSKK